MPVLQQRRTAQRRRQQVSQQAGPARPLQQAIHVRQGHMTVTLTAIRLRRQRPHLAFGKQPYTPAQAPQLGGKLLRIQLPGVTGAIGRDNP